MQLHPDWLIPAWPAPTNVHAVFTTRSGGVSLPPFDSLNLGRPSRDDMQAVSTNRALLQAALGRAPVYLSQVHGTRSVQLPTNSVDSADTLIEADACTSGTPGVVCTIRVADCLPVLLADDRGGGVAAAHAGWRGLASGVLESNFGQLAVVLAGRAGSEAAADVAQHTLAWLGPCIGPKAFEVGGEVRDAFVRHDERAATCFAPLPAGKWLADLAALARMRLHALGINRIYGNDSSRRWCTVANPSRFFSHRRDSVALGASGRMAACIWLD